MKMPITEKLAKEKYPELCQEFLKHLRNSKTKSKNTPEQDFKYSYVWMERIVGDFSFKGVLQRMQNPQIKPIESLEEKVQNRIANTFVSLRISAGRVCKHYPIETPEEIKELIRQKEIDKVEEQKRIDSMSEEDRNDEVESLLKELSKNPGFCMFRMPR